MDYDAKTITAAAAQKAGSYYKLAKALQVTQAAVSAWKLGKSHPSGKHLLEMMKIAGKLSLLAALSASIQSGNVGATDSTVQHTVYYVKLLNRLRRWLSGITLRTFTDTRASTRTVVCRPHATGTLAG